MKRCNVMPSVLGGLLVAASVFTGRPALAADPAAGYTNPVIPGDHPDPSIIRVGKDYWATATSSEWGPEFPLLHSTDLVNWEQTGAVFPHRPFWAVGNFWAPEITRFQERFHVYYVGRAKNGPLSVAVAVADQPGGPYVDHGPLVSQPAGSIDPVVCFDEKDEPYLIWKEDGNSIKKPTPLWAQPLDETGTKLIGERKELFHNDADWEGAVVEGPFVLRRGEWFYLFYSGAGCCGAGCNYALGVARSHALLGPWEKNPANPILKANDQWKCPGHGSIVTDESGRFWLLYHAYAAQGGLFTGREALLDEVKFGANGWPTIHADQGPSSGGSAPLGVPQKPANQGFRDEFKSTQMLPGWEWPQNNEPTFRLGGGKLVLVGQAGHPAGNFAAVLARPTIATDYFATTVVAAEALAPGVLAGLSVFGDSQNALGLSTGGGKLILWRRDHGRRTELAQLEAPAGARLFLRLTTTEGYKFKFAASPDGQHWTSVGDDVLGKGLPPWDRSLRVALVVEGKDQAEARFDSFEFTPAPKPVH